MYFTTFSLTHFLVYIEQICSLIFFPPFELSREFKQYTDDDKATPKTNYGTDFSSLLTEMQNFAHRDNKQKIVFLLCDFR